MKKIIVVIISLLVLGLGWFLVSPLSIKQEVNEELPILSEYSPEEAQDIVSMEPEHEASQAAEIAEPDLVPVPVSTTETIESPVIDDLDPATSEFVTEPEPEVSIIDLGSFVSKNNYSGAGQVKFIQGDGTQTLRFENFSVTNGPDLFVTLNKGDSPKGDYVILGKLKGNKGNQNYDISEYDLDDYNSVSIYCRAFSREFATAQL